MASYDIILKRTEPVADGTLALFFDKPKGFHFTAGQCVRLVLQDPPETDDKGNGRILSLASAPAESELMVATRLRDSAFKRVLARLKPGALLTLKGPYGDFVLPAGENAPLVFVTGGIGITPVRSMVLQALEEGDNRAITLFYANRHLGDAAFLHELQQAFAGRSNYELVTMLTEDSSWQGEQGHLNEAMLRRHIRDLNAPLYYLDGPPGLVAAVRSVLAEAGVPAGRVRTEEFAGY